MEKGTDLRVKLTPSKKNLNDKKKWHSPRLKELRIDKDTMAGSSGTMDASLGLS